MNEKTNTHTCIYVYVYVYVYIKIHPGHLVFRTSSGSETPSPLREAAGRTDLGVLSNVYSGAPTIDTSIGPVNITESPKYPNKGPLGFLCWLGILLMRFGDALYLGTWTLRVYYSKV